MKLLKWILSGIGFILFTIIVLVIVFIILIHDDTNNTIEDIKNNNYEATQVYSREMTEAMYTSDDFVFELDEYELNEVLYSYVKNIDYMMIEGKGVYLTFEEENIKVEFPISIYGFKTCIKGNLKITEENGTFKFVINDAKIGKVSFVSFYTKMMFLNFINDKKIEEKLSQNGVHMDIDSKELSITMTKENILNTLSDLIKDDELSIIPILADLCLDNSELVEFNLNKNNRIGFTIHMQKLLYDETRDDNILYPINLEEAKESAISKLGSVNYKNISSYMNYYINGYNSLTDEEKVLLEGVEIDKNKKAITHSTANTIADVIYKQEPTDITSVLSGFYVSVNEDQFDSIFSSQELIGKTIAFCSDTNVGYITVETLYTEIIDNELGIHLVINVAGKRMVLSIFLGANEQKGLNFECDVTKLSIGGYELDKKYTASLLEYLKKLLDEESKWITINSENEKITLNFSEIFLDTPVFSHIINDNTKISLNSKENGNGELRIKFSI